MVLPIFSSCKNHTASHEKLDCWGTEFLKIGFVLERKVG